MLTCVFRQPHFDSLWVLSEELKANASSVPLNLGGGMYGHLGLLLTSDNKNNKHKPSKSTCKNNKSSPQPRKYCWTHGACAHTSAECNHKADNHHYEVTFENMLGGSSAGCRHDNLGLQIVVLMM